VKKKEDAEIKEKEMLAKKREEVKFNYTQKNKRQNGGEKTNKCKNINYELNVGFDIINQSSSTVDNPNNDKNNNNNNQPTLNLKTIEVYLQMDMIEGKVTETNKTVLNCPYNDQYFIK
jgi:hypothetical protein